MAEKIVAQTNGVGFLGILAVAFIVLKLLGIITWSWWWVTAPLWGPFTLFFGIFLLYLIVSLLSALLKK